MGRFATNTINYDQLVTELLGTPTYTTIANDIAHLATQASGIQAGLQLASIGDTWFVDGGVAASGNGTAPDQAFLTIQEGSNVMLSGDVCIVESGQYDENLTVDGLSVTTPRVRFLAKSPYQVVVINTFGGATSTVLITADYVEFNNFVTFGDILGTGCPVGWHLQGCQLSQLNNCAAALHSSRGFVMDSDNLSTLNKCWAYFVWDAGGANVSFEIITAGCTFLYDCYAITTAFVGDGFRLTGEVILTRCFVTGHFNGFTSGFGQQHIMDCYAGGNTINKALVAGTKVYNFQEDSLITPLNSIQEDLSAIYTRIGAPIGADISADLVVIQTDTQYIDTIAMTAPVHDSVGESVISHDKHFHTKERWLGMKAVQTATDWADDTLNPFIAKSGNDTWGVGAGDEAQVLGTADTPIIADKEEFDIHSVMVTSTSSATVYKCRFIWGTGTMADAITAEQFSEWTYIREASNGRGTMIDVRMPRLPADTQIWCQAWNATDDATISFLVGVHEYDVPEVP